MRETTGHGRPLRTAYALAALSGLLCAAATNAATRHHSAVTREAEIRALRLNADHDAAELSIDLTAPAHYSLSCLRAPDRIVLDLDAHLPGRVHLPAAAG